MKAFLIPASFLLVFFLTGINLFAQDIIIMKSGDEIQSIVTEVGIDVIKYKKFDNPEGPVYSVQKANVFMIKYKNGTKDVFTEQEVVKPKTDTVVVKKTTPAVKAPSYLSYSLGVKLDNKKLSSDEVNKLYANHPEALNLYNKGESFHTLAEVMSYLEIGTLLVTGLIASKKDFPPDKELVAKRGLITVGGMMVLGVTFNITGHSNKRKSVESYNAEIKKITTPSK